MNPKITLRKFPAPFQAALTICNDIDGTNFKNFIRTHHFFNSNEESSLGQGLGLPIGDSFWMYNEPGADDTAFSYFANLNQQQSKWAPLIRDFIACGILDVLHTYGNFCSPGVFSRQLAHTALDELDRYRLKVKTWTNHGCNKNQQKIGKKSGGCGDVTGASNGGETVYHTDLLKKYGIQFFWEQEAQVTSVVGQEREFRYADAYWNSPLYQGFRLKTKHAVKGILNRLDRMYYRISQSHFLPWEPPEPENALICEEMLRDGNRLWKFKRFGNGRLDWCDHLPVLFSEKVIEELLEKQGYLIAYVHLGSRFPNSDGSTLSPESIKTLQKIARYYASGKIWIDTTTRILSYNHIWRHLKWAYEETDYKYLIYIDEKQKMDIKQEDLGGLTFNVPTDKEVNVIFRNRKLPTQEIPDGNIDCRDIRLPLRKIEWPLGKNDVNAILKEN